MPQLTSIDDLLEQMVELGASDLHITVGSPPAFRVRGHIVRAEGYELFDAEDTRATLYRILSSEQQKHFELNRQLDFAYSMPGVARFRVNVYFQREAVGAAFRLIPQEIKTMEELGLPAVLHTLARGAARPRARHRPDRLGQVDDARGDHRRDQPHPVGAHPHRRGPDRVRAPPQEVHRQPARDRPRRD